MWQLEEEVLELVRHHASTLEKVTISGYASNKKYDFGFILKRVVFFFNTSLSVEITVKIHLELQDINI